MAWYGVGTRWGGKVSQLDRFIENGIWENGYHRGEKPEYDAIIDSIVIGDILVAKSHYNKKNPYKIEAVGIVTETSQLVDGKDVLDVKWIGRINVELQEKNEISYLGKERAHTIFAEYDKKVIRIISETLRIERQERNALYE